MPDQPTQPPPDDLACAEEVEMVTDYLEDALPENDVRRFERHLDGCDGCTQYLEQMRAVAGSLHGLRDESLPAEFREGLLAAFRASRGD